MYSSTFSVALFGGLLVNFKPRPIYLRKANQVPIVHVVGWAPRPVWTGENSPPLGFHPRTSNPKRVVVPTELSGPTEIFYKVILWKAVY